MMKNLLFISILALVLSSCSKFFCIGTDIDYNQIENKGAALFKSNDVIKFRTSIKLRNSEMTGIMVVKKMSDSITAGSFINEFGIKGFDFRITPERVEFSYLFKKLDKWYIRSSLGNDLHFLFLRPELKNYCTVDGKPALVKRISHSLTFVYFLSGGEPKLNAEILKRNHKFAVLEQSKSNDELILVKMQHVDGSISYELSEMKN
jgi:hypothetical protein